MLDWVQLGNTPIDYATLLSLLRRYKSPKDKIMALERQKKLIRIKKGLFVVSPEMGGTPLSRELIANHLYGPSYVSIESALSFHHLIPERVYSMRSVTLKRAKKYTTPLGEFDYRSVSPDYYSIGIEQQETTTKTNFLMATPEKALCDIVVLTPGLRLQSPKAMHQYLEEDLRIDIAEKPWNSEIVRECSETGKKKTELKLLFKILQAYE